MDKFTGSPQESAKINSLELNSSEVDELDSSSEVVPLDPDYAVRLGNLLSFVLAELKMPFEMILNKPQGGNERQTNRDNPDHGVFHNTLALLLKSYIELYHAHENADASGGLQLSVDLRPVWIFFKAVSQLQRGEQSLGCSQEELIVGFGAWLGHLNHWTRFTVLQQSAKYHSQRYDEQRDIDDLENAVNFYEQALACLAPDHPTFEAVILDLDVELKKRFKRLGDRSNLYKSIECLSAVAAKLRDESRIMVTVMDRLGVSHMYLFESLGNLGDIEQAIGFLKRAVSLAKEDDKELFVHRSNLASSYQARFTKIGDMNDLNEAIDLLETIIKATPTQHDKFSGYLSNLGSAYARRFKNANVLEDLTRAVDCLSYSVRTIPKNDPHLPSVLQYLAVCLQNRCKHFGNTNDMDEAIECDTQAVLLTPRDHPDWAAGLVQLGGSFLNRYNFFSRAYDIETAIECLTQAILHTPSNHPDMPSHLDQLGGAFTQRSELLGEWKDIENSVECLQKAVYLTPAEHVDMPARLSKLGLALNNRYNYTGDIEDSRHAIECHINALRLTPKGHVDLCYYLSGLGNAYLHLFDRLGRVEHADLAIENLTQVVALISDTSEKPKPLINLAKAYSGLFQRLGHAEDLDRAIRIQYQMQAVELSPVGHTERPKQICNLGVYFHARFASSQEIRDLDNAIACGRRAIELAPANYAQRANILGSLAHAYGSRFEATGQVNDVNTAVELFEQAIALTPEDHADMPKRLNNLGSALALQFPVLHRIDILDKSIDVLEFAASLSVKQDTLSSELLYNIARRYLERFQHFEDQIALFQAIHYLKLSIDSPLGHPQVRFQAAHIVAKLLSRISLAQSLEIYQVAINMIPQLIWLGATIDTRYKDIPQIGPMIQDAVTIATKTENFVLALEWLEKGRSVVWNQMLQLRSPLDDLNSHHPELAERLRAVSVSLHSASSNSGAQYFGPSTSAHFASSREQAARDHRSLAAEHDRLLSEIRTIAGFEDFMLPRKAFNFFRVANNNPVIVIHAHESHCGALALLPGYPHVHYIPLPSMTYDKAKTTRNQLQMSLRRRGVRERSDLRGVKELGQKDYFKSVLATLWTDVVKPVLEELGYMLYPTTELPHITWCTTGPFSFLPIHAAGYYDRPMSKLSDYAISSYTPTLTALLTIEHNDAKPLSSVLAVGQEATPNKSPLPQTVNELDRIKSRATQSETGYMQLDKDGATVSRVLDALGSYSCVHLACHAHQNLVNPLESGFHLHDGTLTLRTIMQQSFQGKQLAFLSACQTAAGDDQIPDEAVHLASGMLMAGYPSVIATMWSISDYYAPLVADEVYGRLMNYGSFKPGATAKALHYAVAKLREEVGDEDFIRWVPYVHFGI